jgi:hypothetical protein
MGFESAAILTNLLHQLLAKTPNPTTEQLDGIFKSYQAGRVKDASYWVTSGGDFLEMLLWKNFSSRVKFFFFRQNPVFFIDILFTPTISRAPVLDFVPFEEHHGKVEWKNHAPLVAA